MVGMAMTLTYTNALCFSCLSASRLIIGTITHASAPVMPFG